MITTDCQVILFIPGKKLWLNRETLINSFYSYNIPEGVSVNGKFYIGWRQRSETFLNAGFDINTPHSDRQLYWLNGEWLQSQMHGTVMMRPVLGDPLRITGIDDIFYKEKSQVNIWPNPANDYINIENSELTFLKAAWITHNGFKRT